jgi:hypothetical protein
MKSSHAEPPAASPLWRRLLAVLIDAALAGAPAAFVVWILVVTDPSPPDIPAWSLLDVVVDYLHLESTRTVVALLGAGLVTLSVLGLQLVAAGSTVGLRLFGLAPRASRQGEVAGSVRLLLWLVLGLGLGAFAGLTWWWGLVDVRRQTLHDRLTGVVVSRRA